SPCILQNSSLAIFCVDFNILMLFAPCFWAVSSFTHLCFVLGGFQVFRLIAPCFLAIFKFYA
ncbi:MAG: hypothetical protein RR454_04525, partial [Clostridia bacterium]